MASTTGGIVLSNNPDSEKFVDELEKRGLIKDISNRESLIRALSQGKSVYFGIDPTSDFLHLGHYLPLSILKRFVLKGYDVIVVLGGLTAQIGDPSFRSRKRTYSEDFSSNTEKIKERLDNLFDGWKEDSKDDIRGRIEIKNNRDFWDSFLDRSDFKNKLSEIIIYFLRDLCGKFNLNDLIKKDFLRDRLENGLTLAESIYPLLQSWDFWYLFEQEKVSIQMGGQDQWANITLGLSLINSNSSRVSDDSLVGFTFPLLTDDKGNKFGKSDGNAIDISNPFKVYQYLVNIDDSLVFRYLYMLTNLTLDTIERWKKDGPRPAKKILAHEVCKEIFGTEKAGYCRDVSAKLFSGNVLDLTVSDFRLISSEIPSKPYPLGHTVSAFEAFKDLNLVKSNADFKRLCKSNGIRVFLNDETVTDFSNIVLSAGDCPCSTEEKQPKVCFLLVRKGQKEYGLIVFTEQLNNSLPWLR